MKRSEYFDPRRFKDEDAEDTLKELEAKLFEAQKALACAQKCGTPQWIKGAKEHLEDTYQKYLNKIKQS